MREDEKYCAIRLQGYLERQHLDVSYQSIQDPPDIVFSVDGEKWAVEHTKLYQNIEVSGMAIPTSKLDAISFQLEKKLHSETDAFRKSGWLLVLFGLLDSNTQKIIEQAVIESVKLNNSSPFNRISSKHAVLIQRNDSENSINVTAAIHSTSKVPLSAKYSADIQATIDYGMAIILKSKAPTLNQLTIYDKRVLLIQSQFPFITEKNMSRSISSLKEISKGIDKIFVVFQEKVFETIIK